MKAVLLAVLAIVSVPSSYADSDKIAQVVDSLSKWTYGIAEHKVKGSTAKAVLKFYADKIDQNSEKYRIIVDLDGRYIPDVDSANDIYGILSAKTAMNMFGGYALAERTPTEKQKAALRAMFGALERADAEFAYGSWGASVCGTTWPALIILDVKGGLAYEVLFVGGDC